MGFTGVFLISFLVVHVYVNGLVFLEWLDAGRGYAAYKSAAHFLGTNPITRILEIGLLVGFIIHIIQGLMLAAQNRSKRPIKYEVYATNKTSTWYSRSMGLLGTLILIFLVIHLGHFWAPNRTQQLIQGQEKDLYLEMQNAFSQLWVVIVYVVGCISLAYHLAHGFFSAFRTLGLSTPRYAPIIKSIGIAFSIIVPFIFALMPIAFHFGWLPEADIASANAKHWMGH